MFLELELKWNPCHGTMFPGPGKKSQIDKEPVIYFLLVSELTLKADSQAGKV